MQTNSLIETKTGVGSFVTILAGYAAWAVVYYIPGVKNNLPSDLQSQLPFVLAWLLATIAAWFAPHTHRPDLYLPQLPPPTPAPVQPPVEEVPLPPSEPEGGAAHAG
jgi:hypothetical protein